MGHYNTGGTHITMVEFSDKNIGKMDSFDEVEELRETAVLLREEAQFLNDINMENLTERQTLTLAGRVVLIDKRMERIENILGVDNVEGLVGVERAELQSLIDREDVEGIKRYFRD